MSNKPNAIVFFDLDGTLLNSQVQVASSSINAINKLHKNNIMPMLATGRTVCEVAHIMQKTQINSIVAMNGQSVFYQGENLFSNDINKELINKVFTFSQLETGIPLAFYNDKLMRISANGQPADVFYQYLKQDQPLVDPTIYLSEPIQMLLLLCEQGASIYVDRFPELTFIRNTPYCVDVFNAGGSKGNAIKQLLNKKGFNDVPTYAFGDGLNDLEMFATVDHPIAMANGVKQLQELAEFITDDNDHDGIEKGLQRAGLI